MVRPAMAAMVSSTKPASLIVSVWMATCTSILVGDAQAGVDGGGRGAPILVQLQAAGAGADLFVQRLGGRRVALAREIRNSSATPRRLRSMRARFQAPGRAGGGVGSGGGSRAAADHRGDAVRERFVNLLRRDEMNVAVDAARGDDQILARDDFGGRADHQLRIDARPSCPDCRPCPPSRCGRRGCRCRLSRCPSDR